MFLKGFNLDLEICIPFFLCADVIIAFIFSSMFYVLPEWERLVLLKLGKYRATLGPGFFIIPPFIYSIAAIVDVRVVTQKVETTATLTKDNVPTKVTAAIEYEIENHQKATTKVRNYLSTIIWLSTEALKNTIGGLDLRELLSNRDEIAKQLKSQIDNATAKDIATSAINTVIRQKKESCGELTQIIYNGDHIQSAVF